MSCLHLFGGLLCYAMNVFKLIMVQLPRLGFAENKGIEANHKKESLLHS